MAIACPVTLLPFDFSSCTSACTKRMIAINNILQWKYDKASHVDIMKKGFDIYVQAWGELALVVLPLHSSTEAYNRAAVPTGYEWSSCLRPQSCARPPRTP